METTRTAGNPADGVQTRARAWKAFQNGFLMFCLFVVLCVVFGSVFKAGETGTFFGAVFGTPLAIHVFRRLAPAQGGRRRIERERIRQRSGRPAIQSVPWQK